MGNVTPRRILVPFLLILAAPHLTQCHAETFTISIGGVTPVATSKSDEGAAAIKQLGSKYVCSSIQGPTCSLISPPSSNTATDPKSSSSSSIPTVLNDLLRKLLAQTVKATAQAAERHADGKQKGQVQATGNTPDTDASSSHATSSPHASSSASSSSRDQHQPSKKKDDVVHDLESMLTQLGVKAAKKLTERMQQRRQHHQGVDINDDDADGHHDDDDQSIEDTQFIELPSDVLDRVLRKQYARQNPDQQPAEVGGVGAGLDEAAAALGIDPSTLTERLQELLHSPSTQQFVEAFTVDMLNGEQHDQMNGINGDALNQLLGEAGRIRTKDGQEMLVYMDIMDQDEWKAMAEQMHEDNEDGDEHAKTKTKQHQQP